MTGRAKPLGMVLPPHDRASGEVESSWPHARDARIPSPLRSSTDDMFSDDHPARVVAHYTRTEQCPDGRHLWDIIESTNYREVYNKHDELIREETDFRLRMTCVRCGIVRGWEGTRVGETYRAQVNPAPLVAGDLVAQEVRGGDSWGRDMSTWTIYRDGARVGSIDWGSGPRGRAFHVARLDEWPHGQNVQGPTPEAALRKLSRALVARTA